MNKNVTYFLLAWAGIGIFSFIANFAYGKNDALFFTLLACSGVSFIIFVIFGFKVVSKFLAMFTMPRK